jgi:hypothetical protein
MPCAGRWSVHRYLRVFLDDPAPIPDATITLSTMPEASTLPQLTAQARVQVVDP